MREQGNRYPDLCSPPDERPGVQSASDGADQLEGVLVCYQKLMDHILMLDGALDRWTSDRIFKAREQGTFAGFGFATDESPPDAPRFRGLRFQITVLYLGTFAPLSTWETSEDPPLRRESMLGDICHCPGKKGDDVARIVEKQCGRWDLNCYDAVAGTGDGGGENEGSSGVHVFFERFNTGYVRKRCLPHISWRTSDMAIKASDLDYQNLAAYFVEGITWTRLRAIATQDPRDHGLGLFATSSKACKDVFSKSPAAIVKNRPETDLHFLQLLKGKEDILHRLASKDLEQRTSLGPETKRAVLNLGDIELRIFRTIMSEILHRCLFLYFWSCDHPNVAAECAWDELFDRAKHQIFDLAVTPEVLQRFERKPEDMHSMPTPPKTWVELSVLYVVGEQTLVAERLQRALDFHRRVTDSAGAHLALLCENTLRTPWMAARLLSKEPELAQAAAKDLARHLASTNTANRTSFEQLLFRQRTSGIPWLTSPTLILLWSSGMVMEGSRPFSGSWVLGSCCLLIMCWTQRESMRYGNGSAITKGPSSS